MPDSTAPQRTPESLTSGFHTVCLNFAQAKPVISPAEVERRKKHVAVAIADERIEGMTLSPEVDEICAAYIRGEIEAQDLVEVYKRRQQQHGALEDGLK